MLSKNGFRFVFRAGTYLWSHKNEVRASDIDCTDMSDDAFEAFVLAH
jgi:hypothetical protein